MLSWGVGNTNSSAQGERALVKLTDFGIVRVVEEGGLTNSGIVLGTADYLSPEQARGETLTASSDLYSLGVVMFEMLAGRPPFVGPTAVSIAMQHASTNPPPVRQFNAAGGTLALNWRKGGGFVDACCIAIETAVGPTNGGRPVSISNITTDRKSVGKGKSVELG